jgi:hypothetical protein
VRHQDISGVGSGPVSRRLTDIEPAPGALLEQAAFVQLVGLPTAGSQRLEMGHELHLGAVDIDDLETNPAQELVEFDVLGAGARVPRPEDVVGVTGDVGGVARPHQLLGRCRLQ